MGAIMAHFLYRFAYVFQCLMGAFLRRCRNVWTPALHQNLECADIQIAVVKKRLQLRHVSRHKTTVLAN
jgi:hypothetical protein